MQVDVKGQLVFWFAPLQKSPLEQSACVEHVSFANFP